MRHNFLEILAVCFCCLSPALFLKCTGGSPLAGSASQSGNGMVAGMVVSGNGTPTAGASVTLRKNTYDPIACPGAAYCFIRTTLTGDSGIFIFDTIPVDTYTVEAIFPGTSERALRFGIVVKAKTTTPLPADTLKPSGILRVHLPDSLVLNGGYVYVPGTGIAGNVDTIQADSGYIEIDSVPAGILPSIFFRPPLSVMADVDTNKITINPQDTTSADFESDTVNLIE